MSITITSTTGSADDLNAAAQMYGDELVQPAEETPADKRGDDHEQGHEAAIARTKNITAFDSSRSAEETQRDSEAVQRDLDEDKAQKTEEYLDSPRIGKTRAKLLNRLSRMHLKVEELEGRLAKYEGQPPPTEQQQNGDGQPARDPQAEQPHQQFSQQQQADQEFLRQFQEAQAALPAKAEDAKARIPDLEQALKRADEENPVSQVAALHISTLPNPFDVAYYLSQHPGIIARCWQLESSGRGDLAIAEISKLSHALEFNFRNGGGQLPRGNRPRPVSAAPAPIRPVGGGGGGAATGSAGDPSKMEYADYKAWYARKYGR